MVAIVDRQKVLHELISNIGRHAAVSMDVFSAMYTCDPQQNPSFDCGHLIWYFFD